MQQFRCVCFCYLILKQLLNKCSLKRTLVLRLISYNKNNAEKWDMKMKKKRLNNKNSHSNERIPRRQVYLSRFIGLCMLPLFMSMHIQKIKVWYKCSPEILKNKQFSNLNLNIFWHICSKTMEFVYVFRWCVTAYIKSKLNIGPAQAAENFF